MTRIMLCADDYALSAGVDAGIVQLVRQGRLSAVSCMTESPRWQVAGNVLLPLRDRIDLGLHFNLTQGFDSPRLSLQQVLRNALLRRISPRFIAEMLHAQLDRFESVAGGAPDFVDGHQHVHMFPGIRRALLNTLAHRYRRRRPWLRRVNPSLAPGPAWSKRLLLAGLDWRFAAGARRRGFRCNPSFAGIYSLQPDADFGALMQHWLHSAREGQLLMCHPGQADMAPADDLMPVDDIAATRPLELAWLAGDEFGDLLTSGTVQLVRFRDLWEIRKAVS